MESQHQIIKQLTTIRDYMRWAVSYFTRSGIYYGHGTDNAWDEALQLVLHGLHLPPEVGPQILDAKITLEERQLLMVLFETRVVERIPAPYLTGTAWFAGLPFKVDERVIVPRSPFAELIENGFQPWLGDQAPQRLLDLCCGSACIGIASAYFLPELEVDVVDISEEALEVAQQNIERYDMLERVFPMQSDVFEQLDAAAKYDIIIANPPYVDAEDLACMPDEYQHEPDISLASGTDGLDVTRRILAQAANYLTDDGLLFVEVGNSCLALEREFPQLPFTWLEFERGGLGVFMLGRQDLLALDGL